MDKLQKIVALELRRLRLDASLAQTSLSKASGVKRTTISNIESGRQATTLDIFCKLSIGLGKQPGELLDSILRQLTLNPTVTIDDVGQDEDVFEAVEATLKKGGNNEEV